MKHSFIGQYLLDRQIVTSQQLDIALNIQRSSNIRLGQLSINQGLLTIKQVIFINKQQRLMNKRFGDIAIDNELLTKAQVGQLLDLQVKQRKLLGEILLEQGFLNEQTLNEVLLAQKSHQKNLAQSIEKTSILNTLERSIKDVLISYEKLFLRCLNSHFKVLRMITNYDEFDQKTNIAALTISHKDQCMCISIAIGKVTMQNICSQFMGIPKEECDTDLAKDATGELLNCIAGYIITDVITTEFSPSPSPPFFLMDVHELIKQYNEPIAVEFASSMGPGKIIVAES